MKYTLNKDGKVKEVREDAIIIDGIEEMKKYYVVRLIKETFSGAKICIAEETFDEKPTTNQIMWCLKKHDDANFASVVDNYKLLEDTDKLPFE